MNKTLVIILVLCGRAEVKSTNEKSAVLFFFVSKSKFRGDYFVVVFFLQKIFEDWFLVSIFHRTARSRTGSGILSISWILTIPWSPTGSGSRFPIPIFAVIPLFDRSGPKIKMGHILEQWIHSMTDR